MASSVCTCGVKRSLVEGSECMCNSVVRGDLCPLKVFADESNTFEGAVQHRALQ